MTNESKTLGCLHSIMNEWDFPMNLTCVRKDLYLAKVGHKIGVLCILMRDIEVHRVFVIRSSFHWTLFSQFHKSQLSWLSVFGYFHLQHKLPSFHSQKKLPWQPITLIIIGRKWGDAKTDLVNATHKFVPWQPITTETAMLSPSCVIRMI